MVDFNSTLYQILGDHIKKRRKEFSLNQTELANKIEGVGRTSISNIEKGRQQPPLHVIYKICNVLDIDIHRILPTYSEVVEKLNLNSSDLLTSYLEDSDIGESTLEKIKELLKQKQK